MTEMTSAPTGTSGGTQESNTTCHDSRADDNRVSAATHLPATPAYLVIVEIRGEKFLRRPYLSLSSAEKAVERARTQGRYATLRLVACTPVPGGGLA